MAKNKKQDSFDIIVEVIREGNKLVPVEVLSREPVNETIPYGARRFAVDRERYLGKKVSKAGNVIWRRIEKDKLPKSYTSPFADPGVSSGENSNDNEYKKLTDDEVRTGVMNAYAKKPNTLVLSELHWKYSVRALLRGENILFNGHSGGGKTLTATTLAKAYGRPVFKFNLGAMQDARTALIGNTHYDPDKGTYFAKSEFVTAITTPGAVVVLDEVSRLSNDAENILLTVLDKDQRYLRIDEHPDTPVVEVADGVCFFGTENVGTEYTSTRQIDRATKDRFTTIVDIPVLTEDEEYNLLKLLYPKVNKELLKGIAKVAWYTRENVISEEPELSTIISTRSTVEQVALLIDGFKFTEVMEAVVFPMYDDEGGVGESERAHMRQVVQGESHLDNVDTFPMAKPKVEVQEVEESENNETDDLFNEDEDFFTN